MFKQIFKAENNTYYLGFFGYGVRKPAGQNWRRIHWGCEDSRLVEEMPSVETSIEKTVGSVIDCA